MKVGKPLLRKKEKNWGVGARTTDITYYNRILGAMETNPQASLNIQDSEGRLYTRRRGHFTPDKLDNCISRYVPRTTAKGA